MPPETDPIENIPVLTDPQNWASRSHQELYAAVHNNNDPGQAGQISSDWGKYGTELTEASTTINQIITASEAKWTGDAAEAARAAMKKLGDWVDETARTAVEVGNKVAEQGRVMENARAQMPAPVQFDWNKAAAALSQPGTPAFVLASVDIAIANASSRAAHDQAVSVMTNMENTSRQIDSSVPTFKPPFNPNTGKVEEPVMAVPTAGGAPTLGGVDSLMAARAQSAGAGTAPAPTPSGGAPSGGSPQAPAAYTPSAPGYTPPGEGGGGGGGAGGYTPQMPSSPQNPGNTNVAAASYTPSAPGYTPPPPAGGGTYTSGSNYTPQFPTGGAPYTPTMGPAGSTPRQNPNYVSQNPNAPKPFTPTAPGYTGPGNPGGGGGGGGAGGGGGGGAAGMKPGAMPNFGAAGGGAGAFGAGGAGGAGGAMQPGGTAGVQGQGARPGMPMGMTGPGAASAAGAPMGGAPMGGAQGGKGDEDKEHRSASYIMGGDLFEVPGENLPPSVIGAGKPKKQKGAEPS
ncbi:PPE domain-containing protein [Lentzea sp. NPDC051213]|uniref:PPE domain-containing protein n=1 Tax=Lentzea sp. NPDC051213 TaxID=3364126 RepID=UPI00378D2DA9